MQKKASLISGIAACALLGASVGCAMNMVKTKKKPVSKTAGNAIKTVGSFIEHMKF